MTRLIDDLLRCTPIDIQWDGPEPVVHWLDCWNVDFIDPFFSQTVDRASRAMPDVPVRQTGIEALIALDEVSPGPKPAGFIFHMSRCGSTLLAQMLASLPRFRVISEAEPVNGLLLGNGRPICEEAKIHWFRCLIRALGRGQSRFTSTYFKFTSWNILRLPFIRAAFPDVPWVFLYRDPVEVLVSLVNDPPAWLEDWTVRRSKNASAVHSDLPAPRMEIKAARMLAGYCEKTIQWLRDGPMLVNYGELPEAAWARIPPFLGIQLSAEDVAMMQRAAQWDAKADSKKIRFTDDRTTKQLGASATIKALAGGKLNALYDRLEQERLSSTANELGEIVS